MFTGPISSDARGARGTPGRRASAPTTSKEHFHEVPICGIGSATCAGPTWLTVANSADGIQVAPYWQPNGYYSGLASGKAGNACDSLPVIVHFTDTVVTGDPACAATINDYRNPLYCKYGVKPPSRYESLFVFATGTDCVGETHSLTATMANNSTGKVLGSTTTTWVAA